MKKMWLIAGLALTSGGDVSQALASKPYRSEPLLPVFCSNLHVALTGKSEFPTLSFRIVFDQMLATLTFDSDVVWHSEYVEE